MGYMHIQNLYKTDVTTNQILLAEPRVYALEKVHGTSAHIRWKDGELTFFSGGEKHANFVALFDVDTLRAKFEHLGHNDLVIYGEAYGGSQQRMGDVYGKQLRFIAFDVKRDDRFVDVPIMVAICEDIGIEVVPYWETDTKIASLDALRDQPSVVAQRRGCGVQTGEGIVLRPLTEMYYKEARVIAKHKTAKFSEHLKARSVVFDAEKQAAAQNASAIADDWVTPMRLDHVLDKLQPNGLRLGIEATSQVCSAMVEDVIREGAGEVSESRALRAAIGRKTVVLFHTRLRNALNEVAQ